MTPSAVPAAQRLEGIHHITAITADAPRNVDFYVRVLGLRLVKKTVNFDSPDVYHLYYGDEGARPGSILTFFEFPGAAVGRAGAGMVHRIVWRVAGEQALDFWEQRLSAEGVDARREAGSLRFADPEGLELELVVAGNAEDPLAGLAPDIPSEHSLLGLEGARAYAAEPARSEPLLSTTLGFEAHDAARWGVAGTQRTSSWRYDQPPDEPGRQGAGTVHHIAWASRDQDHADWRARVAQAGARVTEIIDRQYFRSIYFREPSGVLFEIATLGPGFTVDESAEALGERLMLPPQYEARRAQLERSLTPLSNPRAPE
ncbi:MAG TPA: VOC family protein [Solirubrobacteraceae bacterium]|nr:VOC family protein [Solirubrobacteraceae bacterium]